MAARSSPFPLEEARGILPFDPQRAVCVEFPEGESPLLYRQLLRYVARHGADVRSLRLGGSSLGEGAAGLGWFQLPQPAGATPPAPAASVWVLHQSIGLPMGMQVPRFYHSVVFFVPVLEGGDVATARFLVQELCQRARLEATQPEPPGVPVWRYDRQAGLWRQIATRPPRSWGSVVLPPALEKELEDDAEWFHRAETKRRYAELGLSHRRAYLFSGPPGAGKTSAAVVLAGRYSRPLCIFPRTDETLLAALAKAPPRALLLLEDVAEVSPKDLRELLNGLDGVGTPEDVLFVLTTNDPKPLEEYPALLRPGRVDLHLSFPPADASSAERLFRRFYGLQVSAQEAGAVSAGGVSTPSSASVGGVSMAAVQHLLMACDRRGLGSADCLEVLRSARVVCR